MKTAIKTKILRFGWILLTAFVFVLSFALFTREENTAYAEESVHQTACVGDVVDAKEYKITYGGAAVSAEGLIVVSPSGGVYGGESFIMDKAGVYTITYYVTINGEYVEETKTYLAVRKPQDLIVADAGVEASFGKYEVGSYELQKETYGAIVPFTAGQSITFSTNIKTSMLTEDFNIIDLIVMPSVYKETDFERLIVVITDSENPDNYVEVYVDSSNAVDGGGQVSYVRAGARGQQAGGYEGATFHKDHYGTQIEHSFRGLGYQANVPAKGKEDPRSYLENHIVSEHSLTIAFDHEEKKVYCGPASFEADDKLLVNDLDDPAQYKGNPWGGFTSDEVTVTVKATSFSKAQGKVLIKSFGGYDFSKDVQDTTAPEISIDYPENAQLPVAVVGESFPIFPYTAKDALDQDVKMDVWVYHVSDDGYKINVENDGTSFLVNYAGNYEIVYRAEDYSGNVTERVVQISAVEQRPGIFISIEETLKEAEIYKTVEIPYASDMQVFGGSGIVDLQRAVYAPDKTKLDVKDSLLLTQLGDYKVVYTATDYLGQVVYGVITVRSLAIDAPKFVSKPQFDVKLIKGFTYEIPKAFVVETVVGEVVEVSCKVYVNGELKNDSFKASGEEMEIRYVAEGETGTAEWSDVISVVDTENGKYKSAYFDSNGDLEIKDEKSYTEFVIKGDGNLEFVKPLFAQGFAMTLSYDPEKMNFSKMSITMVDASDRSLSVTAYLFYEKAEDAWFMQLQGSSLKVRYTTSKNIFSFARSTDGNKIVDTSGVAIAEITVYDNGEPFQGFSDTLYLQMAFSGVEEESSLYVTQICNQSMGYSKSSLDKASDEIKPVIVLDETFIIRQKLGSKAQIPTAKAYDVLGQIKEFTVTVARTGGEVIAQGPADQPIDVTLDKAGNYTVTYFVRDTNGNRESIPYVIIVNDETAPTLTVKDSLKSNYKVGDKVKIPEYSATDNGENCYIQVTLIMPNNELLLLHYSENGNVTSYLDKANDVYGNEFKADSNTFILLKKGTYTLRIVAYDEYYNYTVKEIVFNVK